MVTPGDVMRVCRNHFVRERREGAWRVSGGRLEPEGTAHAGDWIAIEGSRRNDGVYLTAEDGTLPDAADESWDGAVWLLAPPRAFLALCEEIRRYDEAHPASDLKSEQFGEYRYVTAAGASGAPVGWQAVYAAALAPWRRMVAEVRC